MSYKPYPRKRSSAISHNEMIEYNNYRYTNNGSTSSYYSTALPLRKKQRLNQSHSHQSAAPTIITHYNSNMENESYATSNVQRSSMNHRRPSTAPITNIQSSYGATAQSVSDISPQSYLPTTVPMPNMASHFAANNSSNIQYHYSSPAPIPPSVETKPVPHPNQYDYQLNKRINKQKQTNWQPLESKINRLSQQQYETAMDISIATRIINRIEAKTNLSIGAALSNSSKTAVNGLGDDPINTTTANICKWEDDDEYKVNVGGKGGINEDFIKREENEMTLSETIADIHFEIELDGLLRSEKS